MEPGTSVGSFRGRLGVKAALKRARVTSPGERVKARALYELLDHYDHRYTVGLCAFDNHGDGYDMWCMPLVESVLAYTDSPCTGLLLAKCLENDDTYTRIGVFGFQSQKTSKWFEATSIKELKIK